MAAIPIKALNRGRSESGNEPLPPERQWTTVVPNGNGRLSSRTAMGGCHPER